jgi:hypothetical protein
MYREMSGSPFDGLSGGAADADRGKARTAMAVSRTQRRRTVGSLPA